MWVNANELLIKDGQQAHHHDYLIGNDIRFRAAGLLPSIMRRWVYKKLRDVKFGTVGPYTGYHIGVWVEDMQDTVWFPAKQVEIRTDK